MKPHCCGSVNARLYRLYYSLFTSRRPKLDYDI